MNTQPKPAGEPISGEDAGNSDAPRVRLGISKADALKPSPENPTGEWTAETVQAFASYDYTLKWCAKVADAHNAALAAAVETERNQWIEINRQHEDAWAKELLRWKDQLAAEREKLVSLIENDTALIKHLGEQLAAEREHHSQR